MLIIVAGVGEGAGTLVVAETLGLSFVWEKDETLLLHVALVRSAYEWVQTFSELKGCLTKKNERLKHLEER